MNFLADTARVAAYELGEAARTRLFQLAILAYLSGVGFANWVFIRILREAEATVATQMGVPATERPGAMLGQLTQNGDLLELLGPLVGTRTAATALLSEPVLALWSGGTAMILLPLVLIFTASGSVAGEVRSRSIRYLLCRTGRLQIGLGKLAGQLLLGLVAAGLGVGLSWTMGMTLMVSQPPVEMATAMARHTALSCAYALPYAGMGLAISGLVPNPNGARAAAAVVFLALHIGAAWLDDYVGIDTIGRLADLARLFFAPTTWRAFWSVDPVVLGSALVHVAVLAIVYYAVGHLRFGTRDL